MWWQVRLTSPWAFSLALLSVKKSMVKGPGVVSVSVTSQLTTGSHVCVFE